MVPLVPFGDVRQQFSFTYVHVEFFPRGDQLLRGDRGLDLGIRRHICVWKQRQLYAGQRVLSPYTLHLYLTP